MRLRKLNQEGIQQFEKYLRELRQGSSESPPLKLLGDSATSEALGDCIEVDENRRFANRYEFGGYLVEALKPLAHQGRIEGDIGLWSALALIWFDQLCPPHGDGTRKCKDICNYILSPDYRHRARHAARTSWLLVSKHSEKARFLLSNAMHVRGDLVEQLSQRSYFLNCAGIIEAAHRLYSDPASPRGFKKGAASAKKLGNVRRFVSWLQQLEVNYDLFSISADNLIAILPGEFKDFLGKL